ncbi:seminase [Drosophila biarmipes]|uniref:seminase n=1 Tax=Drosophila biarmipes TaxID=125945 RepID=UPI0007E68A47|nr:seminase [Drosophila biarmipes]
MGWPKSWLWLGLLLGLSTPEAQGKIYPRDIYQKIPKFRRVWGGVESNTGPNFGGWLLRIVNSNGHFACGGAYYAPLLVITSANCIYPYRNSIEGVTVEGTAYSKCDKENVAEIDTIQFPERFIYHKLYMDVALIRLKDPIKGRLTEFIRLCTVKVQPGMKMVVFGWGHDSPVVQKPSSDPRNSSVSVISVKECRRKFKKVLRLSSTSVCVRQPKNPRQCLYDGGSPMIYNRELCGVVSWGSNCQDTSKPGMYTNIRRVKRFIKETEEGINAGYIFRSPKHEEKERPKPKGNATTEVKVSKAKAVPKTTTVDPLEAMVC